MNKIKQIFQLLPKCDQRLWGDNFVSNLYIGKIALALTILIGVTSIIVPICTGDGNGAIDISSITLVAIPYALHIYESILGSQNAKTAILRSLFMLVWVVVPAVLSAILSILIIIALGIYLIILIFGGLLSGGSSSGKKRKSYIEDEYGHRQEVVSRSGDIITTDTGQRYKESYTDSNKVTRID